VLCRNAKTYRDDPAVSIFRDEVPNPEVADSLKTVVQIYQITWYHIPEIVSTSLEISGD
jgi:hypothetical protein